MGVPRPRGGEYVHAHNVFLQIIHDHGLITGIIFILFGITTFVVVLMRFYRRKEWSDLLIASVLLMFATSGLTEWNFHLCNPFGISLFMVITSLLFKCRNIEENERQ